MCVRRPMKTPWPLLMQPIQQTVVPITASDICNQDWIKSECLRVSKISSCCAIRWHDQYVFLIPYWWGIIGLFLLNSSGKKINSRVTRVRVYITQFSITLPQYCHIHISYCLFFLKKERHYYFHTHITHNATQLYGSSSYCISDWLHFLICNCLVIIFHKHWGTNNSIWHFSFCTA